MFYEAIFVTTIRIFTDIYIVGENCHRGAALGALLGASASWKGKQISDKYKEHLGSAKPQLVQILDAMQSKM